MKNNHAVNAVKPECCQQLLVLTVLKGLVLELVAAKNGWRLPDRLTIVLHVIMIIGMLICRIVAACLEKQVGAADHTPVAALLLLAQLTLYRTVIVNNRTSMAFDCDRTLGCCWHRNAVCRATC